MSARRSSRGVVTLWDLLSMLLVVEGPALAAFDAIRREAGLARGVLEVLVAASVGIALFSGLERAVAALVRRDPESRGTTAALTALYVAKTTLIFVAPAVAPVLMRAIALQPAG